MFFDQAKIHVAAGNGGNGCVSFRREKHVPRGGPDGGDGGAGGDVVLYADPQVRDLQLFSYKVHFKAGSGQQGMGARKHGATGDTVRIPVPLGTQVWSFQSEQDDAQGGAGVRSDEDEQVVAEGSAADARDATDMAGCDLLADLITPGQELVVASGGCGGRGNARFTTSVHQSPKFSELGEVGERSWLRLSLKLMADAGLAGLPNAGKSSLLKRLSNAKPKVADYPFTTLEPMLGVVDWSGEGDVFTLADVPGLLEGASQGVGLGHEFLAHLERCFLLVHVVDITGSSEVEPLDGFKVILGELEAHAAGLAHKPQVVVLNKIDTLPAEEVEAQKERVRGRDRTAEGRGAPRLQLPSAGGGTVRPNTWCGRSRPPLVRGSRRWCNGWGRCCESWARAPWSRPLMAEEPPVAPEGSGHILYRPTGTSERSFIVRRVKNGFTVQGAGVRRLVRRFDLDNEEATRYVAEKLDRLGVYAALKAQGAQPGDEVDVEGYTFQFD